MGYLHHLKLSLKHFNNKAKFLTKTIYIEFI